MSTVLKSDPFVEHIQIECYLNIDIGAHSHWNHITSPYFNMVSTTTSKFGVRFPTRKERTVKRVTKCETREIQKRLEPPKPARVRPPPKPKTSKKQPPPATLSKPPKPPRVSASRCFGRQVSTTSARAEKSDSTSRTLQATDLEKLARLNCSREFGLFNKFIKPELSRSYENQLAFSQTKLQLLKNEFVNKQAEHLNFEQIRDYYNEAVQENIRRHIKPDEYLTMVEKFKQDSKQAIDKWLRKKEFKQPKQVTEFIQKRQARIRDRIKETIEEAKKQQQLEKGTEVDEEVTESSITIASVTTAEPERASTPTIIMEVEEEEEDIMIID